MGKNVFRICGNTFYDQKNTITMKILEFKRSGIGLIVEFRGIPNGFPNQGGAVNLFAVTDRVFVFNGVHRTVGMVPLPFCCSGDFSLALV
jgi:hypothetical protein